jgi:hypothetical protein
MPGAAHETLVEVIRSNPEWFNQLLSVLGHTPTSAHLQVADSSVRVIDAIEVHPDLLFIQGKKRGPWRMIELQRSNDETKQRRWIIAGAALFDQRGVMGDIYVVTHTRATAQWARSVATAVGPHGTQLSLEPVVIHITREIAERLLATGRPELAVFASWAVHHQHGREAVKVVQRAVLMAQKARSKSLRDATIRAIFNMLDGVLRATVYKMIMDFSKIPEGPVHQYLREQFEERGEKRGEKRGEAEALLLVLKQRGIVVDAASRKKILACVEKAKIETWIRRSLTASSLRDVLGAPSAKTARARSPRGG